MKTIILGGPQPPEITAFLARRRALGQDLFDEVWEGDYHVVPAPHPWHAYVHSTLGELLGPLARAAGLVGTTQFNLGDSENYRVPDSGYHRGVPNEVFIPSAAIVVEVLSPHDETWEKFGFFAHHGVEEVCVVDPRAREIRWFVLVDGAYEETGASPLLGVTTRDLTTQIDWPH